MKRVQYIVLFCQLGSKFNRTFLNVEFSSMVTKVSFVTASELNTLSGCNFCPITNKTRGKSTPRLG